MKQNNIHKLKTTQPYFDDIHSRDKFFEIRKNDRDFKVGDYLILILYDEKENKYKDSLMVRKITYITDYSQKDGYVVLGICETNYNDFCPHLLEFFCRGEMRNE